MSKRIGQPAPHTVIVTNKAVFISATAIAAASLVAVAYTLAAPPQATVTATSFVSTHSPSGLVRLSASGLNSLLNARFSPIQTAVTNQGSSAAQEVSVLLGNGSGQLSNDGTVLTLNVPAMGNMNSSVASALGPISARLGNLSGSTGEVANGVNSGALKISPLNLAGPHATVSANVPTDVAAALTPQLMGSTRQGVVTISPHAGTVAIDLSNLLADNGDGSQRLSPDANAEIMADINAAAASLGSNLVSAATTSVENTPVHVSANVNVVSTPSSTGSGSCDGTTSGQTSAPGGGVLSGLLGNTLNGLLGGTAGGTAGGTVSGLLCSLPTNLLGGLLTTLGLNLNSNVAQVIEGTAPPATGSVTVLGSPKPFDGTAFTGDVANSLVTNFGGSTGGGSGAQGGGDGSGGSGGSGIGLTIGGSLGDGGLGLGGVGLGGSGLGGLGGLGLGGSGTGGIGLGGIGIGGLLGSDGTGLAPGFLNSLLAGGQSNLPIGVSVGTGAAASSGGTGSSSTGNLLKLSANTGGNHGLTGSVNVGGSAPTMGTGSGGTGGSLLGGLLHVGTPSTGGSTGGGSIIQLGY